MTHKTAASELIDELGGTAKVGRLLGASMQTVANWRRRGIPIQYLVRLNTLTAPTGRSLSPDVFARREEAADFVSLIAS